MSQDVWADLGNNDFVNRKALQNAITNNIFTGKGVSLTTMDCIKRSECATFAYLNTPSGVSTGFATKSEFVASFAYSGTLNYTAYNVGHSNAYDGWSTSGGACAMSSPTAITMTVYWNGTLGNGTILYSGSGSPICAGTTSTYFNIGGYSFSSSTSGYGTAFTVANYATCTTSGYVSIMDNYPTTYGSCNAARTSATGGIAVYSNINGMVNSVTRFYSDAALTTPFVGNPSVYYSLSNAFGLGTKYGVQIDANGYITSNSSSC